jgi:hypothetical protein
VYRVLFVSCGAAPEQVLQRDGGLVDAALAILADGLHQQHALAAAHLLLDDQTDLRGRDGQYVS